jgi:hypothetical protein
LLNGTTWAYIKQTETKQTVNPVLRLRIGSLSANAWLPSWLNVKLDLLQGCSNKSDAVMI